MEVRFPPMVVLRGPVMSSVITRLPGVSLDLTGFLPGILLSAATSSSSGLLVVVLLKLILVI